MSTLQCPHCVLGCVIESEYVHADYLHTHIQKATPLHHVAGTPHIIALPSPQGYRQRNAYIATQGPLQNTVDDFWRMVWEFKSRVIIMLSPLKEEGCESSYCYWPTQTGEPQLYEGITVTLQSETFDGHLVVRELYVKEEQIIYLHVPPQYHQPPPLPSPRLS